MPRYFFDLADHETIRDDDGTEFADDNAARGAGVVFAGDYISEHPELAWDGREMRVHVSTARREPLFLVVVLGIDLAPPAPPSS